MMPRVLFDRTHHRCNMFCFLRERRPWAVGVRRYFGHKLITPLAQLLATRALGLPRGTSGI